MRRPLRISLSGLSGVGKTTIARELARAMAAVHLRIDSIEQALRDAGWTVQGEGYRIAYAIAEDNLRLGHPVIADCVNPWPLTREQWRAVADRAGAAVMTSNSSARMWWSTGAASSRDDRISRGTHYRRGSMLWSETTGLGPQ